MTLSIDLFWSVRSPYSYLATGRLVEINRTHDLDIAVRMVLPLAIRDADFFKRTNPLFGPYVLRDSRRVAEMHGIPFRWPRPDPVNMDMATRVISPDQPHVHRLTRLGVDAAEQGRGLAFIDEMSRLIWNGDVDGWDQGDHLAKAAARAGLDLAAMETRIEADPDHYTAALDTNHAALEAAGHWGVPTLVFEGEPFFGQDRIELMLWRLRQNGLSER